jgi:4-amino-4-deoxy-L-arabinose transferase-like glycosyltransferase
MNATRAVLMAAALLFVWNIWGYDLWAPDEHFFGEGAREMVVEGRWIVPHVNGVINTHKPPLFFWLISLLSLPLGHVTSLTARLPSVLASLATLALVMRLGRRFAGARAGVLAGAVLASNYLFWDKARTAQIEALLCFLVLAAISAFEAFRSGDGDGRRAGLIFWLACALAVLAKGPVGVLIPLGIALITLALDRNLRAWRRFAPLSGPLLFMITIAAWAVPATLFSGGQYSVLGALQEHFAGRVLHGMHHPQPPWYYLKVLPVQLMPWSGLVPGALLLAWRRRTPGDRLLLVFVLFVVLFFSISTEKRDLYLLPAYPAFALLVAMLISHHTEGRGGGALVHRRWLSVPQALLAGIFLSLGFALPRIGRDFEAVPSAITIIIGSLLVLTAAAMLWSLVAQRTALYSLIPAIGAAMIYLAASSALFPALEPLKSARPFAVEIKEATATYRAAGGEVLAFDIANLPNGISFYSDGVYLREVESVAELAALLSGDRHLYAVVQRQCIGELPEDLRRNIVELASARLSRKDAVLISTDPAR